MRRSLILVVVLSTTGCQTTMLRERTVEQARTITDLYYEQVMNNIALHAANPDALPYFSYPATGQNVIQRTATGSYQLGWDLITAAGSLFKRYLFDKQFAQVTASSQNGETWTTATTYDPDKVQLMKFAYDKAFGNIIPEHDNALCNFMYKPDSADAVINCNACKGEKGISGGGYGITNVPGFPLDYYKKVYPGWFSVGSKHDVPKEACYVGHCGKTYVWVMPNQMPDLSNFTLAILDIATYQSAGSRQQAPGTSGYGILPPPPTAAP